MRKKWILLAVTLSLTALLWPRGDMVLAPAECPQCLPLKGAAQGFPFVAFKDSPKSYTYFTNHRDATEKIEAAGIVGNISLAIIVTYLVFFLNKRVKTVANIRH